MADALTVSNRNIRLHRSDNAHPIVRFGVPKRNWPRNQLHKNRPHKTVPRPEGRTGAGLIPAIDASGTGMCKKYSVAPHSPGAGATRLLGAGPDLFAHPTPIFCKLARWHTRKPWEQTDRRSTCRENSRSKQCSALDPAPSIDDGWEIY